MNSTQLMKENLELRNQLNEENKIYYERILMYIRANLKKEEQLTEETLYEVLQHMVELQQEGKKAADVFGQNPTELAKSILEQLPEMPKTSRWLFNIEVILILLGVYVAMSGIPYLFNGLSPFVYVGSTAIKGLLLVAGLGVVIVFASKMFEVAGEKGQGGGFKWMFLYCIVFGFISIVIYLIPTYMQPIGPSFQVPNYMPVLVGLILVGLSIVMSKIRK